MAKKQNTKKSDSDSDDENPDKNKPSPEDARADYLNDDPFGGLFDESLLEQSRVLLTRIEPKDEGGFCEDIDPNVDSESVQSYIAGKYGGGLYKLERRSTRIGTRGQFMGSCQIKISGQSAQIVRGNENRPSNQVSLSPEMNYKGMNIGGTSEEFMKMLERIAMIKSLEPQPKTEMNDLLLKIALEKSNQDDLLNNVGRIKELSELIKSFSGDSETVGKSWADILDRGIKTFGDLITKPPQGGAVRPRYYRAKPGQIDGPETAQIPENTENTISEGTESMTKNMSKMEIATMQVSTVVCHFMLATKTPPDQVVSLLDANILLEPEVLAQLSQNYDLLVNIGITQLSANGYLAEFEEAEKEWPEYFKSVFDLYADPSREVKIL